MLHHYRWITKAAAAFAATLLIAAPIHATVPHDYPIIMGTGSINTTDFRSFMPGVGVVHGLVGQDPRTENTVSAVFAITSSLDGRLDGVARMRKADAATGTSETRDIPIRGRARWDGEILSGTDGSDGTSLGMIAEFTGRANIAARSEGTALNLRMIGTVQVNTETDTVNRTAEATGAMRYDRTASIRYNGTQAGWVPGLGIAYWGPDDMISLTRPGAPPVASRGPGVIIVGGTPPILDVQTNIRLQTFPLARDRPGFMHVAMASRTARMRLNARHTFLAPREALQTPGFDWRTVPTPWGEYTAATPAGRTVGTKFRLPPDSGDDDVLLPLILGDHE